MSFQIKINNIEIETSASSSIWLAAKSHGIAIPTLCFLDSCKPSASCMVCVVFEKNSKKFLPACSSLVEQGMDIITDNDEIFALRKNAIELLLSEHAGDCVAPCQKACPQHFPIPEINRELINNTISDKHNFTACIDCAAPCEKVCRRKSIDAPIQIKNTLTSRPQWLRNNPADFEKRDKLSFNSSYGKMQEAEKQEFLKECFSVENQIAEQAAKCLHCDCRKADNCALRTKADEYTASQRSFTLSTRKTVEKNFVGANLIHEPNKCIKCGICVQISEKHESNPLIFFGRGFDVKIQLANPLLWENSLTKSAHTLVESCPTGALAFFKNKSVV